MRKEKKVVIFILLLSTLVISLVVIRYEMLIKGKEGIVIERSNVRGGKILKEYNAQETLDLIYSNPNYIGDTITIYENGEMYSSNQKMNGTLNAVTSSEGNMSMVKNDMKTNKLPLHYNIYNIAAIFYRQQYPDEFKK